MIVNGKLILKEPWIKILIKLNLFKGKTPGDLTLSIM